MNTYLAITIGPIYKTFSEAKRTRAVWAASYFYSWFMRRVLEESMNNNMNIFLPDTSKMKKEEQKWKGVKSEFGSGFYADRLYFVKDENTSKEKLIEITEEIKTEVVKLSNSGITGDFLNAYLNLHVIEKMITDAEFKDNNPLAILNTLLDNKELHKNYNFDFEFNELQDYFKKNTNTKDSFLAADAFPDNSDRKFKSISEIATHSFFRMNEFKSIYKSVLNKDLKSKEDTDFIDELINQKIPLLPHHKYYAVIYADGDNIGELIKEINAKNKDIKEFSKTLFEFGLLAEQAINNYGGNSIYLGGEDILAFTPVACIDKSDNSVQYTLFKLIEDLDNAFKDTVVKYANDNNVKTPSMSYGIMISYFKFPLKESMKMAHNLLENIKNGKLDNGAKKYPTKNAIAIHFQKHSGQYIEAVIEKSNLNSTSAIYNIINEYCKTNKAKTDKTHEILSSIIQRFREETFVSLYFEATRTKNLDSFFDNFFNEDIHKTNNEKAIFLSQVKLLSEIIIHDYNDSMKAKNILYLTLRFIHFINSIKEQ